MDKDKVESKKISKVLRARSQQCYYNAFRVIMGIPEYADADYVEGLAVIDHAVVIEHGWIEKDGVVIDPTLPSEDLVYFPGLRFNGRRGLAEAVKIPKPKRTRGDFPIFYRFGWGGIDSPEFRAALIAANRFTGCEHLVKVYEEYGTQVGAALDASPSAC